MALTNSPSEIAPSAHQPAVFFTQSGTLASVPSDDAVWASVSIICSLIKNSTKKIDDEIYSLNENIRFLENRLKDTKLEYDYLSSSEKILKYQKLYFENYLQKKSIDEINIVKILNNQLVVNKLKMSD